MSFQTQSYAEQALGNAGEISKAFHNFCNTESIIVADNNVSVGCFVQSKTDATNEREAIGASGKAITGRILGVVIRDHLTSECVCEDSKTLPKGSNAHILTNGSVFIECNAIAKKGQLVCLNKTTGALVFSNNIATTDAFTGFVVSVGNATATNGIIEITTGGLTPIQTISAAAI